MSAKVFTIGPVLRDHGPLNIYDEKRRAILFATTRKALHEFAASRLGIKKRAGFRDVPHFPHYVLKEPQYARSLRYQATPISRTALAVMVNDNRKRRRAKR